MSGTERNHRFDSDDHSLLQENAPTDFPIVGNVGVFMHRTTDTVTHVISNDAETMRLGKGLNRASDITQVISGNGFIDAGLKAIARDLAELANVRGDFSNVKRPGVIPYPTVHDSARVNGDDITIAKNHIGVGNPMDHRVVNGSANRSGESTVAFECRNASIHSNYLLRKLIELKR